MKRVTYRDIRDQRTHSEYLTDAEKVKKYQNLMPILIEQLDEHHAVIGTISVLGAR